MARVLVVDDDPSVLSALNSLLNSAGHEAVLAASGAEALAQLEGVDAVLTDYSMEGMNGIQLLQALRERDDALPVVLLTAHGSERLAVQAVKAGAYEYLSKPLDSEELLLMLERALEARALRIQNRQLTAESISMRPDDKSSPRMSGGELSLPGFPVLLDFNTVGAFPSVIGTGCRNTDNPRVSRQSK